MRTLLVALIGLLPAASFASTYQIKSGPGYLQYKGLDDLSCSALKAKVSDLATCEVDYKEVESFQIGRYVEMYNREHQSLGAIYVKYWPDSCPTPRYTGVVDTDKPPGSQCERVVCPAGDDAGSWRIPTGYYNKNTNVLLQPIVGDGQLFTMNFCPDGCWAKVTSGDACNDTATDNPNVVLTKCSVQMVQTSGGKCSASKNFEIAPSYTGPDPGAGTDPGGGGTDPGGGGTDPGGGGTDPGGGGTNPGGGGTDPGGGGTDPGGGGTDPGGGGTNPGGGGNGSSDAHCGAAGQPPCKIDETGTPTGIGSMLDPLNKWLEGLGGREGGFADAKSDEGKDTSIGFGLRLPTGACTNPSVGLPFIPGRWEISICQYVPRVAAFFEFLWVFFFAFAVMQLVARATSKPVA